MTASSPERVFYETRSLCPECGELVDGSVVARDGRVVVARSCPEHGHFEGLVCSDVAWFESLDSYSAKGSPPANPNRPTEDGCPEDCGFCPQHQQMTLTAAMEISNRCNADCPVCLADNQATFEVTPAEVEAALENLLRAQGTLDLFALSGGEPTIHPQLFEILDVLDRPEVARIMIDSNGLALASDDELLARLAERDNVYVCLHFDGPNADKLRGIDAATQELALQRLIDHGISVIPLVLATQGVNDQDLGPLVTDLLTRHPAIKSVAISMMSYVGRGGATFAGDPLTRLTIPGALDRIEETTDGVISKRDFTPVPITNPICMASGYFLTMDGEVTPLLPLVGLERLLDYTKKASFGKAEPEFEELLQGTIDRIYANPDDYDDPQKLLGKFRQLMKMLFPEEETLDDVRRRELAEGNLKSVVLMQFMDTWTFDSERASRCACMHLLPGDKIVPSCGYYTYHRRFDPRFAVKS